MRGATPAPSLLIAFTMCNNTAHACHRGVLSASCLGVYMKASASPKDNWALLPKRVLTFALSADALLALLYALTAPLPRTPATKPLIFLFDLNGEGNVPAWYSGAQLLLIALACFALSLWFFQRDERIAPLRRLFVVCGLAFTYLSADEVGQIHENCSQILQSWHWLNLVEIRTLAALGRKVHRLHGGSLWIPIFLVGGAALLWWLRPQLRLAWKLWRREVLLLAIGFGTIVFGAVCVEMLGDMIPKGADAMRLVEVGFEEGFELVGASIMLYAIARILAQAGARLLPTSAEQPAEPAESPAEQP